jgi:hypothetical protein
MKSKSYTYKVKKYNPDRNAKIEYTDKEVKAADMFEVNTTIMRCLVTSLILFSVAHFFAPSKPFIASSSSGSSKYFSTLSFATVGKEIREPEGKIDFS